MASARLFASRCSSLLAATKSSTAVAASGAADALTAAAVKPNVAASSSSAKPRNPLFQKAKPVSPAFQQFLGVSEVSRTEALKQIWSYIKTNNLQNPNNKKEIHCDEKLKSIFDGKEKVEFLQVTSLISKHFPKPELKPKPKTKTISPVFQEFLGASEVSRDDAVKQVWAYIKSKNLQNPENKREIRCDEKLKTIFDGKEKVGFTEIASLISKHFQVAE